MSTESEDGEINTSNDINITNKEECFKNIIEQSTDDTTKMSTLENTLVLPSINKSDNRILCSKRVSFVESNLQSTAGCNSLKLPQIGIQSERLNSKENIQHVTSNKIVSEDINTDMWKMDLEHKNYRLEDSLRDSLQNYDQQRYYLEGENKSTRHMMLEMNEFYLEMAQRLRLLKENLLNSTHKGCERDNEETNISSYESDLHKLISTIEQNDEKVTENAKMLKELKEERNLIHQEIKSLYEESDKSDKQTKDLNPETPYFLLPKNENVNNTGANDIEERPEKVKNVSKKEKTQCEGKDFVTKNRELAKEYNMSRYCLTDEEKRRLQILLSDIDVCEEENTEDCLKEAKRHEKEISRTTDVDETLFGNEINDEDSKNEDPMCNSITFANGFKFHTDESEILCDLDFKLINLKEDTGNENQAINNMESFSNLKEDESKGKHWKFELLQKRLKHIDKDLAAIHLEKEKENNENVEKIDEEEVQDKGTILEEYRRSISNISVDIEELEYEETKELEKE